VREGIRRAPVKTLKRCLRVWDSRFVAPTHNLDDLIFTDVQRQGGKRSATAWPEVRHAGGGCAATCRTKVPRRRSRQLVGESRETATRRSHDFARRGLASLRAVRTVGDCEHLARRATLTATAASRHAIASRVAKRSVSGRDRQRGVTDTLCAAGRRRDMDEAAPAQVPDIRSIRGLMTGGFTGIVATGRTSRAIPPGRDDVGSPGSRA